MAQKRDYYEILGVSKGADEAAIKKHIESWLKNIIRTQMQETRRLSRCLKILQRHILY